MAATVTYDGDIYAVPYTSNTWFMYYDKRVFSEDDVKSLDTMLTKGKVSFPFDNGWYLNAFYAANGCTIFGDGTDKAADMTLAEIRYSSYKLHRRFICKSKLCNG